MATKSSLNPSERGGRGATAVTIRLLLTAAGISAATALGLTLGFRGELVLKHKIRYLESLQSGLLLLQGLLLLLLVHAAEGHAGGGERRDGAGQGGRSERHNLKCFLFSDLQLSVVVHFQENLIIGRK